MNRSWSEQLVAKYGLSLTEDLRAWWDDEVWRREGGAEFNRPLSPQQILKPERGVIWAGFMPPDLLPVIGNSYGDWLCLKVGFDGKISEIVYWCHGGGDWISHGRTLPEALLYDVAQRLTDPRREQFSQTSPASQQTFQFAQWACSQLKCSASAGLEFWKSRESNSIEPLAMLLNNDIAETAVRRDLCLRHLQSPLKDKSDAWVAKELGVQWDPDYVCWLFDTALIPPPQLEILSQRFQMEPQKLIRQNWEAAETEARKIASVRTDLGWALDIAGWSAERRGDFAKAVEYYALGLQASIFTDDSIQFRTQWFSEGYGKFSAARLSELREYLPQKLLDDPYFRLFEENELQSLRSRVCQHWLEKAESAQKQSQHPEAYRCYYNAGWDLGLQEIGSYAKILDGLIISAENAESASLAAVARLHRAFL